MYCRISGEQFFKLLILQGTVVSDCSKYRKGRGEINAKISEAPVCSESMFVKEIKMDTKSGLQELLHMFSIIENELLYLAERHGNQRI